MTEGGNLLSSYRIGLWTCYEVFQGDYLQHGFQTCQEKLYACSDYDAEGVRSSGSQVPCLWIQLAWGPVASPQGNASIFFKSSLLRHTWASAVKMPFRHNLWPFWGGRRRRPTILQLVWREELVLKSFACSWYSWSRSQIEDCSPEPNWELCLSLPGRRRARGNRSAGITRFLSDTQDPLQGKPAWFHSVSLLLHAKECDLWDV